jgi:hypothetical protein
LNALINYVADHTYLHQLMRAGVMEHMVPAYYASYGTATMMKYPQLVRCVVSMSGQINAGR